MISKYSHILAGLPIMYLIVVVAMCVVIGAMCMDSRCLLPLVVCACAGRERIIWRCEIGLVASVYMVLLLN